MKKPNDTSGPHRDRWYHQPIAWLGIAITLILIGACVWTVMISLRYTDTRMHGDTPTVLGVPATGGSAPTP